MDKVLKANTFFEKENSIKISLQSGSKYNFIVFYKSTESNYQQCPVTLEVYNTSFDDYYFIRLHTFR